MASKARIIHTLDYLTKTLALYISFQRSLDGRRTTDPLIHILYPQLELYSFIIFPRSNRFMFIYRVFRTFIPTFNGMLSKYILYCQEYNLWMIKLHLYNPYFIKSLKLLHLLLIGSSNIKSSYIFSLKS